ncbi:GNAT family N-acetyltransferase [Pengzhenrongella sicca]|uniref:GNAT family N-acetyltransferase n=1 Tax=Pengzhenrongella sicca TaxID=2819238 RepID=A0A8A4Z8E4_9MICO|nr:GNAT family N-acetyltransferase [Pengzhenrongella sicca]QTE28142.1 GNAT family N-acetyltransferase [Pengzhenrongella sicca]
MTGGHAAPGPPTAADGLVVWRAYAAQWREVRAVRLAALADSPSAFGSSLQRERQYDEARWREWATSAAVFVASSRGEPAGLAAGVPGDTADARMLVAVWVHPAWRGGGAASRLVRGVEAWARDDGAARMQLWLTDDNTRARRLYAAHGYVDTDRVAPLPRDPDRSQHEMVLRL